MSNNFREKIKLDPDFAEELLHKGVIEGLKHTTPSPETLRRLDKIESSLEGLVESFKEHSKRSEERIEEIVAEFKEGMKDVKYITELLNNANFMKKFFIAAGGVIVFFGSTYLLFRDIFYGQD